MTQTIKIQSALISVFHKTGIEEVINTLNDLNVRLYSTGGTADYIRSLDVMVEDLSNVTGFPSILGGRVKTLHPSVFGGILAQRSSEEHNADLERYGVRTFDLVIVDLYPFAQTVASGGSHAEIIEKIDIGGVSLIRAAAKNYNDVVVIPSFEYFGLFLELLREQGNEITLEQRQYFAQKAFELTAEYDRQIGEYFERVNSTVEFAKTQPVKNKTSLRYGENPHQTAYFKGDWSEIIEQLHGKELSYNNLLDIDAAFRLIAEFDEPTFAVFKHTNPCGIASANTILDAWKSCLACDPISAFGGVIIANRVIDAETAASLNELFFEVLIAPGFSDEALVVLKEKKNRILLLSKSTALPPVIARSILNGMLVQDADNKTASSNDYQCVTQRQPDAATLQDLAFAEKAVKHLKSNSIAIVRNRQLIGSGAGHTSRIDSLKHAVTKAQIFGFDFKNAILASDGFFPFADGVTLAHEAGIETVVQPGGSVRDQESIDYCNQNNMCMLFTGIRHFKH